MKTHLDRFAKSTDGMIRPAMPKDFRKFLQDEFLDRCRKNRRYSLSAFARALQMDTSTLAKILKGIRPVGARAIGRMGVRLGMSPERIKAFALASPRRNARAGNTVVTGANPSPMYSSVAEDIFNIISDWYHYALLELMLLPHFKGEPAWIARTLGITETEAAIATERLEAAGMIKILENGKWIDLTGGFTTTLGHDFTSVAFRNLQRQVLEQSIIALEEVPMKKRSQTSMTMAIRPSRLPVAKKMIVDFQRCLNAFLCEDEKLPTDEIYHLSLSLFPVNANLKSEYK